MNRQMITTLKSKFDEIVHEQGGVEFWYARELQFVLGYVKWDKFLKVIDKGKEACMNSGSMVEDHFLQVEKLINLPKTARRDIGDIALTRYACYLIAQNADPRKDEVAFAQSYFATQTRKQELIEDRLHLIERMNAREKLRESEKRLSQNIYERDVDDAGFARIRSKGDAALFGGKTTAVMKQRLGMPDNRPLADFLPTLTIAAKNLAAEMTNYNTEQKDLHGEYAITGEHVQNNTTVRNMLGERGIIPEDLPPDEDIRKLERRVKLQEKQMRSDKLPKLSATTEDEWREMDE